MASVKWKNEWNNSSYEKASSQVVAKDNVTYDRAADSKKAWDNWASAKKHQDSWKWGLAITGLSLIAGIFGGFATLGKKKKEYSGYLNKILDAKEDLTDNFNNYVDKWNLTTSQQLENLNTSNTNLQQNANITIENRDATLENNANIINEQGKMYATQLEEMQVSARQQEGKALQNVATSGFRNTGTAGNNVKELQRSNTASYNLEKSKIQLSQYQSVAEASNAYKSSTYTAYGYMDNVVSNSQKFDQFMKEQEMNYTQNKKAYDKEMKRYDKDISDLGSWAYHDTEYWGGISQAISVGTSIGLKFV